MKKVQFSIIGTSAIAEKMVHGGKLCPQFSLHSVYSRTKEKGGAFAEKFGMKQVYTDLNEIAQSNVDAVYIASPTALHYSQAKQMLLAGKHVLCEKPACSNADEVQDLMRIAAEKNLIFLEAMRPVFSPGYAFIVKSLEKIGKIRHASFIYCQYSSRYDKFKNGIVENAFRPELSNGALMDIGVYPLHLMISLFGSPEKICSASVGLKDSIDGCGSALLQYKTFLGEVLYSKVSNSQLPCEIQGEEGSILFSPPGTPVNIEIVYRNGEREKADIPQCEWDLFYEINAFCHMIGGSLKPDVYNQNSLATLKVMDSIRVQNNIFFPADKKGLKCSK